MDAIINDASRLVAKSVQILKDRDIKDLQELSDRIDDVTQLLEEALDKLITKK